MTLKDVDSRFINKCVYVFLRNGTKYLSFGVKRHDYDRDKF